MFDSQPTLLSEIEAFLARTGMKPTVFGKRAVGDPRFVFDLRDGRECRSKTGRRVRDFMATAGAGEEAA